MFPSFVGLPIDGLDADQAAADQTEKPGQASTYLLPPWAWMLIFLIGGYLILRVMLED